MFLRNSLTTLGALLIWLTTAPAQTTGVKNAFYAMDTAGGDLALLKELGYAGQSGTLRDSADAVGKHAADLEKRGMKLLAVYVGCTLSKEGLALPAALPEMVKTLKGHGTLIWLHIGRKGIPASAIAGDDLAVPALQKLADQAAAANLRLAIYPHVGDWTEKLQDAMRVAKKVQRPNFGVCFNLCHCLAVGDEKIIPDLLTEARAHLFMVTVNGADSGGKGWNKLIQPLGQGTLDLVPILRQLRQIGYDGPIGFQGYGIQGDRRELLSKTMAGWQKIATAAVSGK